jgi:phosphate acetyltransferase
MGVKVGLMKPISARADIKADLTFKAAAEFTAAQIFEPIKLEDAQTQVMSGNIDNLMEDVVAAFDRASEGVDVMVVEGISPQIDEPFVAELNSAMARTLDAEVILVAAEDLGAAKLQKRLRCTATEFNKARIAGAVINKVQNREEMSALSIFRHNVFKLLGLVPFQPELTSDYEHRDSVMSFVSGNIAEEPFKNALATEREFNLAPAMFRYRLIETSRKLKKRVVLPEGDEPRTIKAAMICHEKGIAHCILLGKPDQISKVAEEHGIALGKGIEILDPDQIRERYVEPMVELRKGKGLTPDAARRELTDTVVLGTMMLAQDEVDGLVSGAVHTTANTIKPAFQLIKTVPGCKAVSSVFFMCLPEQVVVYGDCAVLPNPTVEELADIAVQSAASAAAFGIPPRVAMLSYSTGTSGAGADVEHVKKATDLVREMRPDILIDGPLQFDAATVESVAKSKAPGSKVAGKATVFVFPSLNVGNITYKAVQRSANVVSIGPMLQGLRKPVNDLSRGALVDDIVYTIALTAIQAEQVAQAKKAR